MLYIEASYIHKLRPKLKIHANAKERIENKNQSTNFQYGGWVDSTTSNK